MLEKAHSILHQALFLRPKVTSIYNIGVRTEVRILKVSESKITTEKAFNQDHFELKVTMKQIMTKRTLF